MFCVHHSKVILKKIENVRKEKMMFPSMLGIFHKINLYSKHIPQSSSFQVTGDLIKQTILKPRVVRQIAQVTCLPTSNQGLF